MRNPEKYNLNYLFQCMNIPENHKLIIARRDVENMMDDS